MVIKMKKCPDCKGYGKINDVTLSAGPDKKNPWKDAKILYPYNVIDCETCGGKGIGRKA